MRVAQKQILTPGLVQMVTVLQLNRLELREMINQEVAQNPVLEESAEGADDLTPEEVQQALEQARESQPADQEILKVTGEAETEVTGAETGWEPEAAAAEPAPGPEGGTGAPESGAVEEKHQTDPFEEIDFDSFFQEYLEPGYRTPTAESVDKPSWESFVSAPVTLPDYLHSQLSLAVLSEPLRDAADNIIGNLDENGYLTASLEEMAASGGHKLRDMEEALRAVQALDPSGVGARDLRECLLLQLVTRGGRGGVAWQIVANHMKLLETRQFKELARILGRPAEHIQTACEVIRHLDPRPGLRYSGPGARVIQPDVYISKEGDDYVIELNDDDLPQLRLNRQYLRMLDREQEPNKDIRNYVKERFASATQLIKNIEQRKQTILRVCQAVVRRQRDFLDFGINHLLPMMIKDVAEEIGVHPSTVSRAVSAKYAHTPQGVFELRFFFSEAVQGPSGSTTPLLLLKRHVKKMIEEEDSAHPLTDEQITARLQASGIQVTRRTVAKYREDMKIPSTHQRRVRS